MKKIYTSLLNVMAIVAMAFLVSCEGPAGPAGQDGVNGADGADGTPGVDGNMSCLECHTQVNMDAIDAEYKMSGHGIGAYVAYTSGEGRASCAKCHNNEGFLYMLEEMPNADHSGNLADATDIYNATKIDCETCHSNHGSLEDDIEAPIRTNAPVIADADGITMDFGNNSNLCVNCHQSRLAYETQEAVDSVKVGGVMEAVTAGNFAITSSRTGPHHGPQGNLLAGKLGYGSTSTHAHTNVGCTGCHMGEGDGEEGGHTFNPIVANCTKCHAGATDFNIGSMQTEFDADMALIEAKLLELGLITATGSGVVGQYPAAQFKAYWNWKSLEEDKSRGVHNPTNVNAMIATAKGDLGI